MLATSDREWGKDARKYYDQEYNADHVELPE
jgi:hypothetical protein